MPSYVWFESHILDISAQNYIYNECVRSPNTLLTGAPNVNFRKISDRKTI